jgi:cholesterol oxidase
MWFQNRLVCSFISGCLQFVTDTGITAHPLGGATIGAVCNPYGQVHGYRNLFVVDGAFIPGSTACTNPSLTIAALAERSMDRFLNQRRKY